MTQVSSLPCLAVMAGVQTDEDWLMSIGLFEPDGVTPVSLAGLTLTASLTSLDTGGPIYSGAPVVSGAGSNVLTLTVLAATVAGWPPGLYALEVLASDGTSTCELVDRAKSVLKVGGTRFLSVSALRNALGVGVVNTLVSTAENIATALAALPSSQLQPLAAALNALAEIPPSLEFVKTTSFSPSTPGIYFLLAPNLTMTLPPASLGGDIVVVDLTGLPNLTIAGDIVNAPSSPYLLTTGYASLMFGWSPAYSGWQLV
jgi:hypothetical protein